MTNQQTLVNGIKEEIFTESSAIAEATIRKSEVLSDGYSPSKIVGDLYASRHPFIIDLVGEDGKTSFTPKSMYDAREESKNMFKNELDELAKAYNLTPLHSDEEKAIHLRYKILGLLKNKLTNFDFLNNTVPVNMIESSKEFTPDGKPFMTSPKLSRWITKLVGESSELTKWYTNRCPKGTDVVGENKDYKLTLSVLPHDIIGMSYYAPMNFRGDNWLDGYHGTSCMDVIQNGNGSSMHQLPSNLADETMMVAYLTKINCEDTDRNYRGKMSDIEDIFHARMLVRVVDIGGKIVMLGQRIYATTRSEAKLITEAMKVKFGAYYVHCNDLDNMSYRDSERFTHVYVEQKNKASEEECEHCQGRGYDEDEDDCNTCGGSGEITKYELPYNDNPNQISFYKDKIEFTLPKEFIASLK